MSPESLPHSALLFPFLLQPKLVFVINISSRAGVVEWQTRRTQNPVGVTL